MNCRKAKVFQRIPQIVLSHKKIDPRDELQKGKVFPNNTPNCSITYALSCSILFFKNIEVRC